MTEAGFEHKRFAIYVWRAGEWEVTPRPASHDARWNYPSSLPRLSGDTTPATLKAGEA
ncbi:hypothetical protein [Nonomuraea sp. LPB2021202275-12-8]|uniref:hypothetical protein n=1 Tax=Nonomuraea sp. LPB2021202275-12-8 TaxID=3120159 RepID=UPI00300CC64A